MFIFPPLERKFYEGVESNSESNGEGRGEEEGGELEGEADHQQQDLEHRVVQQVDCCRVFSHSLQKSRPNSKGNNFSGLELF